MHGVDYIFVSRGEFESWIDQGQLLEHATVYGEYKGIPKQQVTTALQRGTDVVLRIDVQGAATVRKLMPAAVTIFLVRRVVDWLLTGQRQPQPALWRSWLLAACLQTATGHMRLAAPLVAYHQFLEQLKQSEHGAKSPHLSMSAHWPGRSGAWLSSEPGRPEASSASHCSLSSLPLCLFAGG